MFGELGMDNAFNEEQIYSALRHSRGDVNKAMDLLLSGEAPAS